jgi:hypothetical protein
MEDADHPTCTSDGNPADFNIVISLYQNLLYGKMYYYER